MKRFGQCYAKVFGLLLLDHLLCIWTLDGGAFEVASGARAHIVGAQVAKVVYRGLRQ